MQVQCEGGLPPSQPSLHAGNGRVYKLLYMYPLHMVTSSSHLSLRIVAGDYPAHGRLWVYRATGPRAIHSMASPTPPWPHEGRRRQASTHYRMDEMAASHRCWSCLHSSL